MRFAGSASKIGDMKEDYQKNEMKQQIKDQYGQGGGTSYTAAFNAAISIFRDSFFQGRTNQRVIIFMTDGGASYPGSQIQTLKGECGVDALYAISYGGGTLAQIVEAFEPNSALLEANASNLTDTFKNILYQINATELEPTPTVDGLLDISDMEVSTEKPMVITVTKNDVLIKKITLTQKPTSGEGVVIIQNGKMYLSVQGLADECGLNNFEGVSVEIEYFAS